MFRNKSRHTSSKHCYRTIGPPFWKGFGWLARRSQDKRSKLLKCLTDAVYIVDTDGRIIFANEAFEHLSGYREEEVLHQPSLMLYPSEVAPIFASRLYPI
jgi:PAS domain-containing protein